METFHLINFGCRASQADGAALKRQLMEAGLREEASPERCRLAVLNTCTVTSRADAEVRQVVRRIHRLNPKCQIVVTGCYAQRSPEEIARLDGVAWVIGNSHKHLLADLLRSCSGESGPGSPPEARADAETTGRAGELVQIQGARFDDHKGRSGSLESRGSKPSRPAGEFREAEAGPKARILVGEIADAFHFAPVFSDDRTRPTLKVQDGCNARCSFCIIPEVRGPSRSLAPETVIDEVRTLEAAGTQEVVLSGINLGSYGKDLDRRVNFLGLLERILAGTSIARLRISSIEPMDVSAELIGLVARETRMARHFHIPLQSGSDRILRLMNRRYWAAQYAERLLAIREQAPNCGLGADVMVGFPGETAEDHAASLRLIESLPFTYLHIFPYSARPGTPAATRDPVENHLVRARGQEIRSLVGRKRKTFLEGQVGRTLSVLTLDDTNHGDRLALSSNYLKVVLPYADILPNSLLNVKGARVTGGLLYGYPAPIRR